MSCTDNTVKDTERPSCILINFEKVLPIVPLVKPDINFKHNRDVWNRSFLRTYELLILQQSVLQTHWSGPCLQRLNSHVNLGVAETLKQNCFPSCMQPVIFLSGNWEIRVGMHMLICSGSCRDASGRVKLVDASLSCCYCITCMRMPLTWMCVGIQRRSASVVVCAGVIFISIPC